MSLLNTLTIIKNAQIAFLLETKIIYTRINVMLLEQLLNTHLIRGYKIINNKYILLYLNYFENKPLIKDILIVSKPSHRMYRHKYLHNTSSINLYYLYTSSKGLALTQVEHTVKGEIIGYIYI